MHVYANMNAAPVKICMPRELSLYGYVQSGCIQFLFVGKGVIADRGCKDDDFDQKKYLAGE